MKIKVSLFNTRLFRNFCVAVSAISVVVSLVCVFFDIPPAVKPIAGIVGIVLMVALYFAMWGYANAKTKAKLNIKGSFVKIQIGDIFTYPGLKVIAFNEYFDTLVDERVIASSSLNGQYINKFVGDIPGFDSDLMTSDHLMKRIYGVNSNRPKGKKTRYSLGTIYKHNDFLLVAFTKFDDENRAYLQMNEYVSCLINFWTEVDILYGGMSVVLPLLGAGLTRFPGYEHISEQELLELLIWSFRVSRVKFRYPACVTILIHEGMKDKINFYHLKS